MSYVDFLNLSADRQKKLKERFHFECTCDHCSQHIKDDLMMAAAESEGKKVREEGFELGFHMGWGFRTTKHRIFLISSFHFYDYDNTICSCFVGVSPSQPSADKVKEVTAFSKDCLEKIEMSRIEKDYHKVHRTNLSFSSCPSP